MSKWKYIPTQVNKIPIKKLGYEGKIQGIMADSLQFSLHHLVIVNICDGVHYNNTESIDDFCNPLLTVMIRICAGISRL